jgi:TP901 family phage tail tape measure protein
MADETISTKIVANADFSALIADVHKVTASLSKLQEQLANSNKMMANQIAVMNRSFSDTLRSTGQFSTHFVSLQSDVEKFGKNLDGGKLKLNQYFNTFRDHARTSGGLIRDLAKQQVALQNSVLQPLGRNAQGLMQFNVHVPRGLDEVKNKAAIARQELQIMNKVLQDGAGQLINWGKNTQWAGRQLTVGLTVPLAAFGAQAAKAFREADQELVRLTKVYGDVAGTSAAELGKVRRDVTETAKQISAAMGVSFKETIGLAADIAATGKTGNELLGSIQETTRLAVLGEVDRQEAMKATLAIQSAFKQNTDELSESINFLNAVENQTSTTLNDLVEAIPKAGPVIQGLGGSVQDLALYLTAMREGGINASEGANALKSALASLINPTDVAVGKFQTLGIDLLGIVNNNAGNLTGTLMALQGALDNLNPLQKQQAIEQLFGKFQFSRLNALFENLGRQGSQTLQVLDLMKASSSELAQVADRELSAVTESASGKYRRALESLKASLAEVGEQFLTINTVLIQVIDKVVQFANNLPKPVKQILALLGGFTAIIGPVIMLTGVLANFFGYLLKGAAHMKAFFKGGEGWKYLTPEMLAAEKAGKLVEQSFYSDAKAAAVLQQALRNLLDEFAMLEAKAKSGAMAVNPAVSTMAGNLVMAAGGQRVVNKDHPLAGDYGTRASSHMVSRVGRDPASQTMFGMVPGAIPVNAAIGQNPQIYMNETLPNVPGLTTVKGVSTGIVSGEAARWHAMMATLGMQSKSEIETLKKTIAATGTVSKEFMMQFDDILPVVSKLTDNAARESAMIVAELRAGKLTVESARAKIVALNLQTEQMIASSVSASAASMGRTINPTMVPTLNQPVVDAAGKSNMRELFKKGKTRDFVNRIAGVLGVRTSGAGYNIETTIPRKMNSGGYVYGMNNGSIVPGPNVNADIVPAMLTPGEFVVNREAAQANLPLLTAINGGAGSGGVGMITGGQAKSLIGLPTEFLRRINLVSGARRTDTRSGRQAFSSGANNYDQMGSRSGRNSAWSDPVLAAGRPGKDEVVGHIYNNQFYRQFGGPGGSGSSPRATGSVFERMTGVSLPSSRSGYSGTYDILPNQFITIPRSFNTRLNRGGATTADWFAAQRRPEHLLSLMQLLTSQGIPQSKALGVAQQVLGKINSNMSRLPANAVINERMFGNIVTNSTRSTLNGLRTMGQRAQFQASRLPNPGYGGVQRFNRGGMVQRYNRGGFVRSMLGGTGIAIGGQMLGSQIGGGLGTAISMGSGLLGSMYSFGGMSGGAEGGQRGIFGRQMDKIPAQLKQPVGPLNSLSAAASKTAGSLSGIARVFGPLLKGFSSLLRLTSPLGLGLTAVGATVGFLIKKHKEHTEELRVNRAAFGMTADAAQKAGYKYTDYNKQIKGAIEDAKALKAQNKMIYESMTNANVPIKMTIEQYKKLKEQVKSTMQDYIKLFDQTDRKDVGQVAVQLKAQFMAAGDSAEEATAKIYALISESKNASLAGTAIGNKAFQGIQTLQDAAIQTTKTFEAAMTASDTKGQASAILNSFEAINGSISETIRKSEEAAAVNDSAVKTVGEATTEQIDKINDSYKKQTHLTRGVIDEIGKTSPELAKTLNSTDTLVSAWAKYQLLVQGVNIDVSTLSGTAAVAAAKLSSIITSTVKTTGAVGAQYKEYDRLKGKIKDLEKAQRGQSAKAQIDSRDAIASLNKQIEKIRKAAQDKINGIRKATEAENTQLEIQKAQLRAQQALATGNMTAYAEEQMGIEQLLNDANRKAAEEAILTKAELEIKPLQDKIDSLSKKNQDLADKAALAGDSLAVLQKKATTLNDNLTTYTTNLSNVIYGLQNIPKFKDSPEYKEALVALGEFGKKLGITEKPESVIDQMSKALKEIHADEVTLYTGQIKTGRVSYTKENPFSPVDEGITGLANTKNKAGIYVLDDPSKRKVVEEGNLDDNDVFVYQGRYYRVKNADWRTDPTTGKRMLVNKPDVVAGDRTSKALGGPFAAGDKLLVNDRRNSLGYQQEGIAIDPNFSGTIYPNAATMPRFDLPTQTKLSGVNITSSPNSNNLYNIDINLNGTNVTADDVMRKFKQELALVSAKEGPSKYVGGAI